MARDPKSCMIGSNFFREPYSCGRGSGRLPSHLHTTTLRGAPSPGWHSRFSPVSPSRPPFQPSISRTLQRKQESPTCSRKLNGFCRRSTPVPK